MTKKELNTNVPSNKAVEELIARVNALNLTIDSKKITEQELLEMISSYENTTTGTIIDETIIELENDVIDFQTKLNTEKAKEKAKKPTIETLTENIKNTKTKLKTLVILANLYKIKGISDSTELFDKITKHNELGQFWNFKINSAIKTLSELIASHKNINTEKINNEVSNMKNAYSIINSTIKTIDKAQLYEFIRKDILPRIIDNNVSSVEFSESKKAIDTFCKVNKSIFSSDIDMCINLGEGKNFIWGLCNPTQNSTKNTSKIVKFEKFLTAFQGLVSTKINKIQLVIEKTEKIMITETADTEPSKDTESTNTVDTIQTVQKPDKK